jgi:predicted ester cyclase
MRSALVPPLTILLAIATALALLGTAVELSAPPPVAFDRPHNADLVRRFYAAANSLLATGVSDPLVELVAGDVVEHPQRLGDAAGRDGLVASLRSLRDVFPGLRLVVDGVQDGDGGFVTAMIHTAGATDGVFLGIPVAGELAAWGPLEVVRVVDGRIAERWSSGAEPARFVPLLAASVDAIRFQQHLPAEAYPPAAGDDRVALVVERVTLTPGARWSLPPDGGRRALIVEARELTVLTGEVHDLSRPGRLLVAPDRLPEDRPVAAAAASFAAPSDSPEPTVVLVVAIVPAGSQALTGSSASKPSPPAAPPPALPGVTQSTLVVSSDLLVPPGARLALGRAMFGQGHGLACASASGAVLLAVEAGTVELATAEGIGTATRGGAGTGLGEVVGQAVLGAGDGAWLVSDGGWWRASGPSPAMLLVLTITQDLGARIIATPAR